MRRPSSRPASSASRSTPSAATEEYLAGQLKIRPLVELLTRSKAFHTFAAAAPGLPELVTVGKIWSLAIALDAAGAPVWDTVIVDCPATGHGVALLETAGNVEELAAGGPDPRPGGPHPRGRVAPRGHRHRPRRTARGAGRQRGDRGRRPAARARPAGGRAVLNGVREARFSADDERRALEAVARASAGPSARRPGRPWPTAPTRWPTPPTASGWPPRPGCRSSTSRRSCARRFDLAPSRSWPSASRSTGRRGQRRVIADLADRRLVVCCGAGGVGKTTISAAVALRLAQAGRRTVVVTIDPARRLATRAGHDRARRRPPARAGRGRSRPGGGELWALQLDAKATFDRLVARDARRRGGPRADPREPDLPAPVGRRGRRPGVHGRRAPARAGGGGPLRPDRAGHPARRQRARLPRRPASASPASSRGARCACCCGRARAAAGSAGS